MANDTTTAHRGLPLPYRYVWLLGLLFTLMFVAQAYVSYLYRHSEDPFAWFFYTTTMSSHYLLWVLLTPLLYRLSLLHRDRGVLTVRRVLTHIAIGLPLAWSHGVVSSTLRNLWYFLRDGEWMPLFSGHSLASIMASVFSTLVEYLVIIGAFVAIDTYRMYRAKELELVRMENELNNAQLEALKMQLQPHFLFNTLHSISSLMNENIGKAQRVVTRLGFLLRSILDQEQKHRIPLRAELEFVRSYLDIEEIRFADRLRVEYDVAEDTLDARVPNLILQPLVENAIKHGFSRHPGAGRITVSSRISGDDLVLTVGDNGCGVEDVDAVLQRSGVGIRNVRARLEQMYGPRGRFAIESRPGEGFRTMLTIPRDRSGGDE